MLTILLGYNILILEYPVKHLGLKRGEIMRLSTRGRYGLKAMFQLALHYGQGPISIKQIALEQELSENYLEQLFSTLRKEGFLHSVRGAQGGYMLSKEPSQITVGQILRALEGNIAPHDCVVDEEFECSKEDRCVTKHVWMRIKNSIDEVIDSITLQDMLEDSKKIFEQEDE
mgnify:CR=1 FL=1